MKKTNITGFLVAAFILISCNHLYAQQTSDKSEKLSVSMALNHDAFFGFNPAMSVAYPINKKVDFTAYGIIWGAGTASAWGNWTEFGVGVNFKSGSFAINPQIGFTMGSLLSSGAANPGIIGDGIVPNVTVNFDNSKFLGQLYTGYYGALRNNTTQAGQATNNYTHYWLNAGYKLTNWLAAGAHYEHLFLNGGEKFSDGGSLERTNGYKWIGPFVQLSKKSVGMRFSFGKDIDEGQGTFSRSDFYKMSFFLNL